MEAPMAPLQKPIQKVQTRGFGLRAGAYVIDVVVLWITTLSIFFITSFILGIVLFAIGRDINLEEQQSSGLDLLIGFVTSTLYFIIFEWLYGATPGKLILGMRVIMEKGTPCTFRAALIRSLLRYVDGLFFGIPAYMNMNEPLLQRIGDKSAKTIVISAKDSNIQKPREWWWFILASGIYLSIESVTSIIQTFAMLR